MNLKEFIYTELLESPHFERVFLYPSIKWSDSEKTITSMLSNALGIDAVHALSRDEHTDDISATYTLTSSEPINYERVAVVQQDVYLVRVRARTVRELIESKQKIMDAINTVVGAELIDMLEDYDSDISMNRLNIAISLSSLRTSDSGYPSALVIDGSRSSDQNIHDVNYRQVITDEAVIIAASPDWKATLDEIYSKILGQMIGDGSKRPVIYIKSEPISQTGGLSIYAHTFIHSFTKRRG